MVECESKRPLISDFKSRSFVLSNAQDIFSDVVSWFSPEYGIEVFTVSVAFEVTSHACVGPNGSTVTLSSPVTLERPVSILTGLPRTSGPFTHHIVYIFCDAPICRVSKGFRLDML